MDAESFEHPFFSRVAAALAARPGRPAQGSENAVRAAVAIIFRLGPFDAPELLLIQRAEWEGDPWSGHVALPGGRRDATDATLQDTAIRETREEISLDLATDGRVLGTLDELHPRSPMLPPIVVTPFVFALTGDAELRPTEEVAEAFWVPLSMFADENVVRESVIRARDAEWRVPSYVLGRHVVWGMTERILRNLLDVIGG